MQTVLSVLQHQAVQIDRYFKGVSSYLPRQTNSPLIFKYIFL